MKSASFRIKTRLTLILLGLALLTTLIGTAGSADRGVSAQGGVAPLNTGGDEIAKPGEVIVQVDPNRAGSGNKGIDTTLQSAGLDGNPVTPMLDPNVYLVHVSQGEERIASANLAEAPGVVDASPNYARYIFSTPNDSNFPLQWNLPTISLTRAWDTPQTRQVIVAVLDTGLDLDHPEFRGRVVPGYDFVNNDADPSDDQGHGTHVAGIIAAAANNGDGIAGIAWNALIMPIKVADDHGRIYSDAWINGLAYARQHGAQVVNMSFGGPNYSAAEQSAVSKAWDGGLVVVAAAGNCGGGSPGCQGTNPLLYPAGYDNAIGVGAVGDNLKRAYYSEYNGSVDLVAPGGDAKLASDAPNHWILSTFPTLMNSNYTRGYGLNIGTSMAAPHVTGLAALMLSTADNWTNATIKAKMQRSAYDLGPAGRDDEYGYGLINAAAAIANGPGSVQATATPQAPTATARPIPPTATAQPAPPSATPTQRPPTATATTPPPPPTATNTPAPTATIGTPKVVGFGCVFADVCQSDPFYPYVANLARDGILSGYADNTFRPLERLTRGALAKMLVLSTGRAPFQSPAAHFADVQQGSTYYSFIESIYVADIISGYRDGTFRPEAAVSRAQLVKMVSLAENWELHAPQAPSFRDVGPGSTFYPYVETALAHGALAAESGPDFRPADYATRAEAARIVDLARR